MGSSNGGADELKWMAELSKNLKEGERILAPSRRPDGTYRKPIRIRAGYVPQEEVAIYQSKGALWRKEMASQIGPPGYDPDAEAKPKTKSAKRNERKKEKRQQAALEKGLHAEAETAGDTKGVAIGVEDAAHVSASIDTLASQMDELAVSSNASTANAASNSSEAADAGTHGLEIDKRIRGLKKKIRLAEGQQQKTALKEMKPEQLEKLSKLESWRQELKLLEEKKAGLATS